MLNIVVMPITSAGERMLSAIASKIPSAKLIIIPFVKIGANNDFFEQKQLIDLKINQLGIVKNDINYILIESIATHAKLVEKLLTFFNDEFKNAEVMCI